MQNWQTSHRHSAYVFKGKKTPTYLPSQKPAALLPPGLHRNATTTLLLPLLCTVLLLHNTKMKQKEQGEIQR